MSSFPNIPVASLTEKLRKMLRRKVPTHRNLIGTPQGSLDDQPLHPVTFMAAIGGNVCRSHFTPHWRARADHVGVSLGMLVTTTLAEDLGRRIQAPLAPRESRRRCSAMASWRKNCRDDAMMSGCGNVVVLAAFSSCANMGRLRKGAESCALSTEYVISEFSPFTVADQTMAATGIPA